MTTAPIPLELCPRRYAEMKRKGETSRYCDECRKSVYDLSAMTRAEAVALLASSCDLCVRYLYDLRGRPVHRPSGKKRVWLAVAAMAAAPLLIEACGGAPRGYDYQPTYEDERESEEELNRARGTAEGSR